MTRYLPHRAVALAGLALAIGGAFAGAAPAATLYDAEGSGGIGIVNPGAPPTVLAPGARILGPHASPVGDNVAWIEYLPAQPPALVVRSDSGTGRVQIDAARLEWVGWSPDGRHVLVRTTHGTAGETRLLLVRAERALALQSFAEAKPSWSPDGRYLALEGDARTVWDSRTSSFLSAEIIPAVSCCFHWSPDGRRVAFESATGWRVVTLKSGGPSPVRLPDPLGPRDAILSDFHWSPDGNLLVYNVGPSATNSFPGGIAVQRVAGVSRTRTHPEHPVLSPAFVLPDGNEVWSPDSTRLIVGDRSQPGRSFVWHFDSDDPPVPLQAGLQKLRWSPTGRRLAGTSSSTVGRDRRVREALTIVDAATGDVVASRSKKDWTFLGDLLWIPKETGVYATAQTSGVPSQVSISLSISGTLKVFAPRKVVWNPTRTMAFDGRRFLLPSGRPVAGPATSANDPRRAEVAAWLNDGKTIVFREYGSGIYTARVGERAHRISRPAPIRWEATLLGISPNGRTIVYSRSGNPAPRGRTDGRGVFVVDRSGRNTHRVIGPSAAPRGPEFTVEWSPDSTRFRLANRAGPTLDG